MIINTFTPHNAYLSEFLVELRRRWRAINYKYRETSYSTLIEKEDDKTLESFRIVLRKKAKSVKTFVVRISVREDRWVVIDARQPAAVGWNPEFTISGRLASNLGAAVLVRKIEELDYLLDISGDANLIAKFERSWRAMLPAGPIGTT